MLAVGVTAQNLFHWVGVPSWKLFLCTNELLLTWMAVKFDLSHLWKTAVSIAKAD